LPWSAAALAALLALAAPQRPARAAEPFSFYGVSFGMKAAEIDARWKRLGEGAYAVPSLGIQEVQASFDHEGRLYELSFALVAQEAGVPQAIQMRAIQQAVEGRWGKAGAAADAGLDVSIAASRDSTRIRVTNRRLLEGYVSFVQERIGALLKP
jgi:hypothetical protein